MTDIEDIRPALPLDQGCGWTALVFFGLGLVLVGLIVRRLWPQGAAWWRVRALRRKCQRLEAETGRLTDRDFYDRLVALVRRGLAERTGRALEASSSEELLTAFTALPGPERTRQAMADVLRRADAARFGDSRPEGGTKTAATPRRHDLATVRALLTARS